MAAEDREQAGRDRLGVEPGGDCGGDLDEAVAAGLDFELVDGLSHLARP
jgi:hypothetical protein